VDGSVVAGLIAAGGTACGGIGGLVGVVLSTRRQREATTAEAEAGHEQMGYDLLALSIDSAHREIKRLRRQQDEDRREARKEVAELRGELADCHDERDRYASELRRMTNGA
jgi:hypothetical protein